MKFETGQIVSDKYRIVRSLGSGPKGEVYEGATVHGERRIALKALPPSALIRPDNVERYERAARTAARLGSPHIVEVLDVGPLPDGGFYIVTDYLEGKSLGAHLTAKGRMTPREIIPWIQQALTGLESAHAAELVHRDLKPENVFLCHEEGGHGSLVKLLDFGISKFDSLDGSLSLTKTDGSMGTPFYIAPEQATGAKDIDSRSDLYAVGVILYEAVTGQKPFNAPTFNDLMFKIVLEPAPPPENFVPNLDPAFGRILRRAMARAPSDRYQTAGSFRDALSKWLHTGTDLETSALTPPTASDEVDGRTLLVDRGARFPGGERRMDDASDGAISEVSVTGSPADHSVAARGPQKVGKPAFRRVLVFGAAGCLLLGMGVAWCLLSPIRPGARSPNGPGASADVSQRLREQATSASSTGPDPVMATPPSSQLGEVAPAPSDTPHERPSAEGDLPPGPATSSWRPPNPSPPKRPPPRLIKTVL